MTLDRNKTVWQRLALELKAAMPDADDKEVARLTEALHPYVVAERNEAKRTVGYKLIGFDLEATEARLREARELPEPPKRTVHAWGEGLGVLGP